MTDAIPAPTSATRLFALLGDPVGHSLSPTFQNAALRAAGLDAVYLALRCNPDDLPGLLRGIARAGGGGNVTVPHKERAALSVEERTAAVEATGACNTFWLEAGRVCGDNTDVVGFARSARSLLEGPLTGARVLLLGAGGSARAVVHALVEEGAERIAVVNRTEERARELAERFSPSATRIDTYSAVHPLRAESFDLAVNTTSLGLRATDPLPLDPGDSPAVGAVLDLVYSPERTPWVRHMAEQGIAARDGLEMLLFQGAAAFERWWGRPAPLGEMRASLPREP